MPGRGWRKREGEYGSRKLRSAYEHKSTMEAPIDKNGTTTAKSDGMKHGAVTMMFGPRKEADPSQLHGKTSMAACKHDDKPSKMEVGSSKNDDAS